jgi:hypothetical protein
MSMAQSNRKEYDDLLKKSGAANRKIEAAQKGRIAIVPKRDTSRLEFERLLNKAQRSSDDVVPKALRNRS